MSLPSPTTDLKVSKFTVQAVLFDMDGTLTDSIAAVEAAWTAKAEELGLDPDEVIAATHGRRAEDNLLELVPNLKREDIHREVEKFEKSILTFADTPPSLSRRSSIGSRRSSRAGSQSGTPARSNSISSARRPSMGFSGGLQFALSRIEGADKKFTVDDDAVSDANTEDWIDMSVRILPGVRKLIHSLPKGTYAVATSGAKTYCHGCLTRTRIDIPDVCVTADDPRLKRGKPFPDPFLLAASDLNVDPKRCVIFEDSPSGIKAAVAAGSTVIAVCTSHQRHKIDKYGAHYIVDTMDQIKVITLENGELEFEIRH